MLKITPTPILLVYLYNHHEVKVDIINIGTIANKNSTKNAAKLGISLIPNKYIGIYCMLNNRMYGEIFSISVLMKLIMMDPAVCRVLYTWR